MPAAALPLATALGAVPFQRELKDWTATCDNTRSCTLKAIPDDLGKPSPVGIVITVMRDAGPAKQPSVDLYPDDGKLIDPRRLRLDGRPLPILAWREEDSETHDISVDGADALLLSRLLRDGHVLTLGAEADAPGASLHGAAAAFLAMDEAQGRVGGVTAIVRPGPAPASATARAAPRPVIVAAPRPPPLKDGPTLAAAVRHARAAELEAEDCRPDRAKNDTAEPLNATEAVVILDCAMGAYQGSSLVYRARLADPAAARPLVPPPFPSQDKADATANPLTEASYDPDTATLSSSARGRGVGDCGVSMDWTFDGHEFRPSGWSRQVRCGGEGNAWPAVWLTTVVPAAKPKRR